MAIPYGKYRGGGAYLNIRPGDGALEMEILDSTIEPSKYTDANGSPREDVVLIVDVDGETHKWRLNAGANAALDRAKVDVGDRIVVARRDDDVSSGRTLSQWEITKVGGDDVPPF